jgi:hypothetical protein
MIQTCLISENQRFPSRVLQKQWQEFTPQHPERGGFHVAWPPEGAAHCRCQMVKLGEGPFWMGKLW